MLLSYHRRLGCSVKACSFRSNCLLIAALLGDGYLCYILLCLAPSVEIETCRHRLLLLVPPSKVHFCLRFLLEVLPNLNLHLISYDLHISIS